MERAEREKLVDVAELAEHFGVQISTVHSWTYKRRVPFFSAGKNLRFKISDVEAALFQAPRSSGLPAVARSREKVKVAKTKGHTIRGKSRGKTPLQEVLLEVSSGSALQSGPDNLPGSQERR